MTPSFESLKRESVPPYLLTFSDELIPYVTLGMMHATIDVKLKVMNLRVFIENDGIEVIVLVTSEYVFA